MRDADSRRQRLAWEMALNLRGPSREAWLVRAVTDGPGPVRLTAVRGLAQDGQAQKQMDLFIQAAKDNDSDVATAAAMMSTIFLRIARICDAFA